MQDENERRLLEAHQAGRAYWRMNRPHDATRENLASLARSCGWSGELCEVWLAGFYGAKSRDALAAFATSASA